MTDARCGHEVLDADGIAQPCDRPARGWRWYQDVEHEDCLEPACGIHANEGGRRIHQAEEAVAQAASLLVAAIELLDQEVGSDG